MSESELQYLLSALRGYLEDLRESGVDGLPVSAFVRKDEGDDAGIEETPVAETSPPAGMVESVKETLDTIRAELGECLRCPLGKSRNNIVFGRGSEKARLVFVGEAPGREEDLAGEPFVGEAGRLLTKIIQAMGFEREQVYICNVLKCRPPGNRNPRPEEINVCEPFLRGQLRVIGPEVVVALGTFSAQSLLQSREPISRLRGRFHDYHGIALMPTFHPAYLLRNPAMKRHVWDDMQVVMKRLGVKRP